MNWYRHRRTPRRDFRPRLSPEPRRRLHRPGVTVLGSAATHSSLAEQPDVIAGSLVGFASAIGLLTEAADFEVERFRLRVGLASDFLSASTAAHAPVKRCGVPNPKNIGAPRVQLGGSDRTATARRTGDRIQVDEAS
jgi:hypothetical protein